MQGNVLAVLEMREQDIRPGYLMQENAELHAADVRKLLVRRESFEEVPCPACLSTRYEELFEKKGFHFVICTDCDTLFTNPRPTRRMLDEFYTTAQSVKHWNDRIFPPSEDARRTQIFTPRAKRVVELTRKYGVPTRTLLDVGAGFGTFCEEISKLGVFERVIAVEPSYDLASTCRLKGLEVIESPIE